MQFSFHHFVKKKLFLTSDVVSENVYFTLDMCDNVKTVCHVTSDISMWQVGMLKENIL